MDVFRHNQYRDLIESLIHLRGNETKRSELAKAAGCSPSWITRVLNGSVQITPEQTLGIANHFHLTEIETDYFLGLVDLERAASLPLRKRIQKKLDSLKRQGSTLGAAVKTDAAISEENTVRYYSSWIYPAIHVACMAGPCSSQEISERLQIPFSKAQEVIRALSAMGLLAAELGKWKATHKAVHLPASHSMAHIAHANWRHRTAQRLQDHGSDGLHYSAVHCLSKKDAQIILEILKEAVLRCQKTIEASNSETLMVFCLDWFGL